METAKDILRRYFPDIQDKSLTFEVAFLEMHWLNASTMEPGFEEKVEQRRIDTAEKALRTLWQQYSTIPLKLRQNDGRDIEQRILALYYDLLGHHPRAGFSDRRREHLPPKPAGLDAIRAALRDAPKIHHTQRLNNAKIHLVGQARDLWRTYKGREAPRSPSPTSDPERRSGNFYEFVSDLIQYAGHDWTADNALRLWRERYPG